MFPNRLVHRVFVIAALSGCDASVPEPVSDLPASVEVDEGGVVSVPVADGTEVVSATSGLTAAIAGGTLTIRAALNSADGEVDVSSLCSDVACSATIAVNVRRLEFTRAVLSGDAEGPEAREHGALLVSSDGATFFLLGGGGYPNVPTQATLDDAWRFDRATSTWSPWTISGDLPSVGASRRVVQDGDVAFLHGGYDDDTYSNADLYRVDVTTGVFTRMQQVNPPPHRCLHSFGGNAATLVVFGGFTADDVTQDILADTWVGTVDGDTVTWEQVSDRGPSARYGGFSGTDGDGFYVYSGAGFPLQNDPINALDDAWRFDMVTRTWFQLWPAGDEQPAGRRNGCGVVDPSRHTMFVFGGTADGQTSEQGVWMLELRGDGVWHRLDRDGQPPFRSSSFGTALPGGGFACGFGNDRDAYRDIFTFAPGP